MTVNSPSSYASLAKKYKFDYVVHGDDWKTGPQAESRKKLKITMKEWNGKLSIFHILKRYLQQL